MEGGKEQNYWPGFVDALSNVVLTLVFVLVIFVFALLMASNKVEKKMEEAVKAEAAHKAAQSELNKALTELETLRQKEAEAGLRNTENGSQQACVKFGKSDDKNQKAESNSSSLLIFFAPSAISVTQQTQEVIGAFVKAHHLANDEAKFIVEASDNPDSASPLLSRETQLGRMLNIRNGLLSAKVDAHNISIHNIPPLKQKDSYDWVKIYVGK